MNRSQEDHAGAVPEQVREFFHLQSPNAAVSVYLHRDLVEKLRAAVLEKTAANTELGGVLFGRKKFDGAHRTVEIVDFQAIQGQHTSAFLPNRTDFLSIVEICSVRRSDDLIAVGLLRSRSDRAVRLDPADAGLADRFFSGPDSIFLVLRPAGDHRVECGLFLPSAGESFESGASAAAFEIEPGGVKASATLPATLTEHDEPPVPEMAASHAPAPPEFTDTNVPYTVPAWLNETPTGRRDRPASPPDWPPARRAASVPRWMWSAVAVCVIGAAAFTGTYLWRRLAAPPPAEPESIRVDRDGSDLRAVWNRNAPLFRGARKAVLAIRDGNEVKEIALDLRLESGMVLYTPVTGDVEFRMQVSGKTERTESIHVVAPAMPGAQWTSTIAVPAARPAAHPPSAQKVQVPAADSANRSHVQRPETNPLTEPVRADEPAPANQPAEKAFIPPNTRVLEDSSALPPPPGLGTVVDLRRTAAPPSTAAARIPAPVPTPAAPAPQPAAPAETNAAASRSQRVSSPDTFTHPKPKVQVPPRISPLMRATMGETSTVSVTVAVDKAGKVASARVSRSTTSNTALQRLALDAAKRWQFVPATLNGQPVPSEVVLNFNFGPQ